MKNKNTTAKGNEFRDHILALLRTKYPDAKSEVLVGWKKADIAFTGNIFGRVTRFAVECKNYDRKLATRELTTILTEYDAAFGERDIEFLIVVSNFDIEAASRSLVEKTPRLRFMTYAELEDWIIGIRSYVETISSVFSSDDVHSYYIDGRFEGQTTPAFDHVRSWIDAPASNGLAILGGYGLGKSSLAKKIVSDQAKRYLCNPFSERIPILIRLGQVVHETELSGLFGKHFTDQYRVEGYNFQTLMHLNASGRLLIVLDGFDEMKHAMTETDFRSNFREFNRLRTPNAKVLLLGRPSALTSDSSDLLIQGLNKFAGQTYQDSEFPRWEEHLLSFFNRDEGRDFLTKFLRHSQRDNIAFNVDARVDEVMSDIHGEILQRPVQARIVGQLAASPTYSFKNINTFELYDDFVIKMLEREQEKVARKKIPVEDRRRFLNELAWWAWTRDNAVQGIFRKDEVPQVIFDQFSNGDAIDQRSKRSEYLVSSMTEQKDADVLYFAHRSFQEFLVASWIANLSQIDQAVTVKISRSANYEILDFLFAARNKDYLFQLYSTLNTRLRQPISFYLLVLLNGSGEVVDRISDKEAWELSVYDSVIMGSLLDQSSGDARTASMDWLYNAVRSAPIAAADYAFHFILNDAMGSHENEAIVQGRVLAVAWERILSGVTKGSINDTSVLVEHQHFGAMGSLLRNICKKSRSLEGRKVLWEPERACQEFSRQLKNDEKIDNLASPLLVENLTGIEIEIDATLIESFMPEETAKLFASVFVAKGNAFNLVSRSEKAAPRLSSES